MSLAIIPARSGSKRISNKNIKFFLKKPIISYSILQAKKSKLFKEIIVSTDSNKIKKIVNKFGSKVYYLRSNKLSDDHCPVEDVLVDILLFLKKKKLLTKYFCLIYATAPLIDRKDLIKSFRILENSNSNVDSVTAIAEFSYPIQRALKINKQGFVEMIDSKYKYYRSQDLEKSYHDAAAFSWFKTSNFLNKIKKKKLKVLGYVLSNNRVHDIDTSEDWKVAENKYQLINKFTK
jgi:pseudaminic acid cytidylyltransferase